MPPPTIHTYCTPHAPRTPAYHYPLFTPPTGSGLVSVPRRAIGLCQYGFAVTAFAYFATYLLPRNACAACCAARIFVTCLSQQTPRVAFTAFARTRHGTATPLCHAGIPTHFYHTTLHADHITRSWVNYPSLFILWVHTAVLVLTHTAPLQWTTAHLPVTPALATHTTLHSCTPAVLPLLCPRTTLLIPLGLPYMNTHVLYLPTHTLWHAFLVPSPALLVNTNTPFIHYSWFWCYTSPPGCYSPCRHAACRHLHRIPLPHTPLFLPGVLNAPLPPFPPLPRGFPNATATQRFFYPGLCHTFCRAVLTLKHCAPPLARADLCHPIPLPACVGRLHAALTPHAVTAVMGVLTAPPLPHTHFARLYRHDPIAGA